MYKRAKSVYVINIQPSEHVRLLQTWHNVTILIPMIIITSPQARI